jgi:hypothetical protein
LIFEFDKVLVLLVPEKSDAAMQNNLDYTQEWSQLKNWFDCTKTKAITINLPRPENGLSILALMNLRLFVKQRCGGILVDNFPLENGF